MKRKNMCRNRPLYINKFLCLLYHKSETKRLPILTPKKHSIPAFTTRFYIIWTTILASHRSLLSSDSVSWIKSGATHFILISADSSNIKSEMGIQIENSNNKFPKKTRLICKKSVFTYMKSIRNQLLKKAKY